ncbi:MMPL family transporter [Corynebacterium simulans]|uniref:MMPL family transporter n=1 Tax=Corynebacterium TaxID=1716 RepID=UPI001911D1F0|nr:MULTISPECIES: MMPL family transporter [Corynebacterium]MCK6160341.1 MMPL family transporter [Corynebacterium simulans]
MRGREDARADTRRVARSVLLDTLIVRTVLVPALVQILGEKFWWPAHLKRAATNSASAQAATPRE